MDELPYLDWVRSVTGGTIAGVTLAPSGASRSTALVDVDRGGTVDHLVLRTDTGDGPLSGTELSLAREAAVYRALTGSGLPVAGFRAVADDGMALLLERVAGTSDWSQLGEHPAQQEAVARSFAAALSALHAIDAGRFDCEPLVRPAGPRDHALNELRLWQRVLDARVRRPVPIVRFAFRWLAEHAPESDATVLCHGDAGAGNFMFDGDRVTALVDWEFAHFGDPMDDLAWTTVRGQGFWPTTEVLKAYAAASGRTIDFRRVRYYQALVVLRMAVCCLVAIENRKGETNLTVHFTLLPAAEAGLMQILADLAGEPLDTPAYQPTFELPEAAAYLAEQLVPSLAARLTDPFARSRLVGIPSLVAHLGARSVIGPEVDALSTEIAQRILERPVSDWPTAERELEEGVEDGTVDLEKALGSMRALAEARLQLWPLARSFDVPSPSC